MGQGPSKDTPNSEEEQRQQKEEKERLKREKKEQKAREKREKKEQKELKKKEKEQKEKGSKQRKDGSKKGPEGQTVRSTASQNTVRKTFPRPADDDDISLDPVDNTPDYDDDINLDPVNPTPPTPTDSRPDQTSMEEVRTLITRATANDPSLKSLSIAGHVAFKRMTRETKEEIQGLLADALQKNTYISELTLTRLGLDDAFAVSLAHSLTFNHTLSVLNLNGNEISGVGVQALANVLAVNTSLREVSLRNQDAKLGVEGEEAMLAILETNRTLLKLELDLMDQKVSKWINQRLAENLKRTSLLAAPQPLPAPPQNFFLLTPLRLRVMALITNNSDDETLDFANEDEFASFTEQEKTAVAGGLGINDQIKKADFSNTRLTDSFAQVLAMSLHSNGSLSSLSLENNLLSAEGLKAIAAALKTNKALKELRIGKQQEQEEFGREIEEFFAECLSQNRCLVTLKMKIATKEIQERVEECLRRNAQA